MGATVPNLILGGPFSEVVDEDIKWVIKRRSNNNNVDLDKVSISTHNVDRAVSRPTSVGTTCQWEAYPTDTDIALFTLDNGWLGFQLILSYK